MGRSTEAAEARVEKHPDMDMRKYMQMYTIQLAGWNEFLFAKYASSGMVM